MKKIAISLVLIFTVYFSFFVSNSDAQWTQTNGPNGGWCESMCVHGGYLYVSAHGSVIFRSSDNGNSWSKVHAFPFYMSENTLTSHGSYLFIATSSNGVWRSSDNGISWTEANTGFPYNIYPVENIVVSGQYLICGAYRLYRSSNYGNNWDSCTNGMAVPLSIYRLSVFGNKVYAGTTKGAYVSTNNGGDWTSINNGISTQSVLKISSDGTSLYAGASNGVYKSTNQGAQWFAINNGLPSTWFYDVIYDGTYLLATTLSGMYRSSNAGQNWEGCNNGLTSNSSIRYYSPGTRLFALLWGGAGIQYTTNHGSDWIVSNSGYRNFFSDFIAVKDNKIYVCGYQQGLAVSTDDGASWQNIFNTTIDRFVRSVAANNTCVFISTTNKGLLKSTNNGINWISCNNGIDSSDTKSLFAYDDVVIASNTYNSTSFCSTNNGANWTAFSSPNTIEATARIGNVMLASNSSMEGGGMIRSTNKGVTWFNAYVNFFPTCLAAKDSVFYSYGLSNFYKSTNLGLNWIQFPSDLPLSPANLYVIDNKLVSISGKYVYTSSNNGTNWISKSQGLPIQEELGSLAVKGANVFITTSHSSVWKITKTDLLPVREVSNEIPASYSLSQNYPNPFNQTSIFKFQCSMKGHVNVSVYDIAGREVQTLVNETLQPGTYEVRFDGSELNSGVYLVRMKAGDYSETRKMVLLK